MKNGVQMVRAGRGGGAERDCKRRAEESVGRRKVAERDQCKQGYSHMCAASSFG